MINCFFMYTPTDVIRGINNKYLELHYGSPAHNPILLVDYGSRKIWVPVVNFTPNENPYLWTLDESGLEQTSKRLADHVGIKQDVVKQELDSIVQSFRQKEAMYAPET